MLTTVREYIDTEHVQIMVLKMHLLGRGSMLK